jgi:hypothetical protein
LPITKFFLAQFLVEVDLTDRREFDDVAAVDSAFRLSGNDKKHDVKVYPLSAKPDSRKDVLIEEYEYCGYPIEVYQNAHIVGADIATYFATVTKLHTKSKHGAVTDDSESIEVVKNCAGEVLVQFEIENEPVPPESMSISLCRDARIDVHF